MNLGTQKGGRVMTVYPLHIEVSGDLRSLDMVSFVGGIAQERVPFFFSRPTSQYAESVEVSPRRVFLTMEDVRIGCGHSHSRVQERKRRPLLGVLSLDDFGHISEWPAINQSALWSSGMIRASGNSHIRTMILCEVSGSIPDKALLSSFLTPASRFPCFCFCLFLQVSLPGRDSAVCSGDLLGKPASLAPSTWPSLTPLSGNLTSSIPNIKTVIECWSGPATLPPLLSFSASSSTQLSVYSNSPVNCPTSISRRTPWHQSRTRSSSASSPTRIPRLSRR